MKSGYLLGVYGPALKDQDREVCCINWKESYEGLSPSSFRNNGV